MTNPAMKYEVADVLSSLRRLVGDTKKPPTSGMDADKSDVLVLTPQLRVIERDVLRLKPEQAVVPINRWQEIEEPPVPSNEPASVPHDHTRPNAQRSDSAEFTRAVVSPSKEHLALSAKIAALETAIGKTEDQWEPDGMGRDAYAGTTGPAMAWHEDVDLDGTGKPLQEETKPTISPEAQPVPTVRTEVQAHEDVIDEETLRAMVAQIIRSEFQGELGERITRNVRKLVRREIQRALTARALD